LLNEWEVENRGLIAHWYPLIFWYDGTMCGLMLML